MTSHSTPSTAAETKVLALLFSYRGPIVCPRYLAKIHLQGRLIARISSDGTVWLEGVNPGAIAVTGDSLASANTELRRVLTNVFSDFAEEAETGPKFRALVKKFFSETDDVSVAEWKDAVTRFREGNVNAPSELPRYSADDEIVVEVAYKSLARVTTADNDAAAAPNRLATAA